MSAGWICLHRGLLDWEWYNDINTTRLFIHCLLRANHKPKKWRGIDIERGQFWTSLPTLQQETGLSASQLRTAISKLKSTGELADKSQATGRMVTVCKYEQYQGNDRPVSRPVTDQSQTSDRPVTANNNDNNENHENNENKLKEVIQKDEVDYSPLCMTDSQVVEVKRIRKQNKGGKITQRVINGLAKEFEKAAGMGLGAEQILTEWEMRGWKSFKADWCKPNGFDKAGKFDQSVDVLENMQIEPQQNGLLTHE